MLYRSTWSLSVSEPTTLPRSYGLELVKDLHRRMDLDFGTDPIPPISFGGLRGSAQVNGDWITFFPHECYELMLGGLDDCAAKAILSLDFSTGLDFLGGHFSVDECHNVQTSYEELYTIWVADEPELERRWELDFITPTAFSQGRSSLPLPVPILMFRSWLERWNHFSSIYLGDRELLGYLDEAISLSRHRLQTRTFSVHRGRIPGFVGQVTLQAPLRADALVVNVANLLIRYGQFAGVGAKTRLGMGMISLLA